MSTPLFNVYIAQILIFHSIIQLNNFSYAEKISPTGESIYDDIIGGFTKAYVNTDASSRAFKTACGEYFHRTTCLFMRIGVFELNGLGSRSESPQDCYPNKGISTDKNESEERYALDIGSWKDSIERSLGSSKSQKSNKKKNKKSKNKEPKKQAKSNSKNKTKSKSRKSKKSAREKVTKKVKKKVKLKA